LDLRMVVRIHRGQWADRRASTGRGL